MPRAEELVSYTPDRFSLFGFIDSMTEEGELARELEQDKQAAAEVLCAGDRSPERTEFREERHGTASALVSRAEWG